MATVYVLGAGASRAFNPGAPLMSELLEKALTVSEQGEGSQSIGFIPPVRTFMGKFYGSGNRFGPPPLEDVLSQLDHCIVNNLPLSSEYDVKKLREVRRMLIYIMGGAIQRGLRNQTNDKLVRGFLGLLRPGDSIITLNYDLIIDNALLRRDRGVDYGIPIRNRRSNRLGSAFSGRLNYPLLKLHGSLNWLYCPVCRAIDLTETLKGALDALLDAAVCDECDVPLEAVIVTPSYLKDYNNSFVVQIWRAAEQKLQKADEVVFIGYSLPDADITLRMLFSRALFTNKSLRKKSKCKFRVINWVNPEHKGVQGFVDGVRERYTRLFNNIDYDDTGLQAYTSSIY